MSDTSDPSIESDLLADATPATTPVEVAEKRRWRWLLRFMKREGERRDRSMMINAAITMYATL